jgi:DNA-binding transcriptional regulator YiaG
MTAYVSKKFPNRMMAEIHEGVSDLYKVGAVDEKKMREFDVLCGLVVKPIDGSNLTPKAEESKVAE